MRSSRFSDGRFIVMFHGNISPDRCIDTLIRTLTVNPYILLVVLGNPQLPEHLSSLVELAEELKVSDRVIFHPAVPNRELWKYVGAADVGTVVHSDLSLNSRYSLPNKFFENVQSLTPLIVSDLPELGRTVRKYGVGLTYKPGDVDSLNQQIEELRNNDELYSQIRENLVKAKAELCWEKEREPLVAAYRELLHSL